jgi:steroid 5-alpha reductase family enzyme
MGFLGVSAAAMALVYGATFVVGRRIGRYNVVDVTRGLSLVAVAAVAAVAGGGDLVRRLLLWALVTVCGLRLASHIRGYRSRTSSFVPRRSRSRIS